MTEKEYQLKLMEANKAMREYEKEMKKKCAYLTDQHHTQENTMNTPTSQNK